MWSTTITEKQRNFDQLRVRVNFSDGIITHEELLYCNSQEDLRLQIARKLATLETVDSFEAQLQIGVFDSKPVVVIPSQTDKDKLDFLSNYRQFQGMNRAVDNGLKKETDQDYIDLQDLLKEQFKPEYSINI